MIEIIREEDASGTTERRGLPKDIKQIGKPDIGDRIYVENQVYQFIHPYSSLEEKRAYVLLGRFENYAGKECVFVEAAIPLREMEFEGELPLWNDQTWAYIYKQLRHEYDSMVIVGWAMDIKGQLPNMTMRLENLHQNNFGGTHQILYLMDSLEREEAFYGSRNGHLYRREGFYIYYEKNAAGQRRAEIYAAEALRDGTSFGTEAGNLSETGNPKDGASRSGDLSRSEELSRSGDLNRSGELSRSEELRRELEENWHIEETGREDSWKRGEDSEAENVFAEEKAADHPLFGREMIHRGSYRKEASGREERQFIPSYASTFLLLTVVCVLGITAYLNNEKMAAMEATLAQMNQPQEVAAEEVSETESQTENPEVKVESVAGNVQKQEELQTADADQTSQQPQGDAVSGAMGAAGTTEVGTDGGSGTSDAVNGTSDAAGTVNGTSDAAGMAQTTGTSEQAETAQNAGTTGQAGAAATQPSAAGAATDTSTMTEAQTYLNQGYYVVQKGDSLVGICRKIYQTTAMMDKLCEVNEIEDENSIYAGQRLILPN